MIELNVVDDQKASAIVDRRPFRLNWDRWRGRRNASRYFIVFYEEADDRVLRIEPEQWVPSAEDLWARQFDQLRQEGRATQLFATARVENRSLIVSPDASLPVDVRELVACAFGSHQPYSGLSEAFGTCRVVVLPGEADHGSVSQLVAEFGLQIWPL